MAFTIFFGGPISSMGWMTIPLDILLTMGHVDIYSYGGSEGYSGILLNISNYLSVDRGIIFAIWVIKRLFSRECIYKDRGSHSPNQILIWIISSRYKAHEREPSWQK